MADFIQALDVSSNQPSDLSAIINQEKPDHIVVRMYIPGERPPAQYSLDQVASARAAGCTVGAYLWAYRSFDPRKSVRDALAVAKQCGMDPPPILWIDCELYKVGNSVEDPGPDADWLRQAIDECRQQGVQPGIYTGGWWWKGYMGDTQEFGDVPLWAAEYQGAAVPSAVTLFGGWKQAHGKQWSGTGLDRDVFLMEATTLGPLTNAPTLDELAANNPNIQEQLRIWQRNQVIQGTDPLDYPAFRQFQIEIGAPDPGEVEFIGFDRHRIEDLEAYNPNIEKQLVDWQIQQKEAGTDPLDYEAFRQFQQAIGAPDPGPEFIGFLRADIGYLKSRNPNIDEQLDKWRELQTQQGLDPLDYAAFRKFQTDLGAPDPGPWEFDGFRPDTAPAPAPATPPPPTDGAVAVPA